MWARVDVIQNKEIMYRANSVIILPLCASLTSINTVTNLKVLFSQPCLQQIFFSVMSN